MKKIVLLLATFLLSMAGFAETGTFGENDALTWTFDEDGTLTFSGEGEIPEYIWQETAPWSAFKDDVRKAVFEGGVTVIGNSTIQSYPQLDSVFILDGVQEIGICAIYDCPNLKYIEIPASVTSIGAEAFGGLSSLATVVVSWENPIYVNQYIFLGKPDECILKVPAGTKSLYEAAAGWNDFIIEEAGLTGLPAVAAGDARIYTGRLTIAVAGAQGETVVVYDVAGRLVAGVKAESGLVSIPVPQAGVYLVRVGGEVKKAAVR